MSSTPSAEAIDEHVQALIESLDALVDIDDMALRDRLVQLERVVNMTQQAQAHVMCEMSRRAGPSEYEFVADEIAITLSTTKPVASHRLALAFGAQNHPLVMKGWSSGAIDARKVGVICDGLADASPLAIEALAGGAVDYAGSHTPPELRRWLSRRVIAVDPEAAECQRQRALADRKVSVTPLGNGLSEFMALLPSVQARQIYDTVNAIAHASDSDDHRLMDQRRADALVDLVTGRAEPPQVNVQVVVPAGTLLGNGKEPGSVAGVGPITPTQARELVDTGTGLSDVFFRRLLVDPTNGRLVDISEKQYRPSNALDRAVRARDQVCRFPGCCRPASTKGSGTDLDHTIPWPRGETRASNLAVLCRHHHRLKHLPGWSVTLAPDGVMRWITPSGKSFVTEAWVYADTG
jgi:hypothetical protein